MYLKKNGRSIVLYLAALLLFLNLNSGVPAFAAENRQHAMTEGVSGEYETAGVVSDRPASSSGETLPPAETAETDAEKESDVLAETGGAQQTEHTEGTAGTEKVTEAGTAGRETEFASGHTEPVSENQEIPGNTDEDTNGNTNGEPATEPVSETETGSEPQSDQAEQNSEQEEISEAEELITEMDSHDELNEETVPAEESEEPGESETEEAAEKEPSALFELLREWWESMEMALVTKILQLILAFILFFTGRRIINAIIRVMDRIAVAKGWDPTVCSFARNAARAVLYVALAMSILTCVGVEIASLAAIISSIGVAIGLALQGSLSNLAGGLLLAIIKPIHLGDYVSASGYSGTVREVGLVYTTLVGADDRTVIIPNSTLMSSVIENYSEQTTRRVEVQCPISYDADLKRAMDIFRRVLEGIPERLPDKPVNVFIANFGDSAVVLEGQIYVRWTQYLTSLWTVREKIKLSFDSAGIEIPLPQIDVHMKQGAGE